jgi:hypothetical protein
MFHEVAFPFDRDETVSRNALAAVNRLMASIVASSAERAFVSIPGWEPSVRAMVGPDKPVDWLPVPSAIPVLSDPEASAAVRARYAGRQPLVGHFGTHGAAIRSLLASSIPSLVDTTGCHVMLVGRRGDDVRRELLAQHPALEGRLHATGLLSDAAVSIHIAACDLMLQPYPDGVSSRRTSAMVTLSHGVPMVTTSGWLTEALWEESGAAVLVPVDDRPALADAAVRLLADPARRAAIAEKARTIYENKFDVRHTISALRSADAYAYSAGR